MRTVVDSSVLIAALNKLDSQHARGVAALRKAAKPIVVPEYVVAETCAVLTQKAGKRLADGFVRELGSNRDLQVLFSSPEFFIAAARTFLSVRKKLSFVDCSLLVLSKEHSVLTFDRALSRALAER